MSKKCLVGLCVICIIASFICLSVYAAFDADYKLTINNIPEEYLKTGNISVSVTYEAAKECDAFLYAALYSENVLVNISMSEYEIKNGTNILDIGNLSAQDKDDVLVIMLCEKEIFAPLMDAIYVYRYDEVPVIEEFSLVIPGTDNKGNPTSKAYSGLIDGNSKEIYVNVPVSINKDGKVDDAKKDGDYAGTPSKDEVNEALKNITPDIVCSLGAEVVGKKENLDLSNGGKIVVADSKNRISEYAVKVSADTVQRDISFNASKTLVHPKHTYGSNHKRHGAPTATHTLAGGGTWELENFKYQKNLADEYIVDAAASEDKTGYVRCDDTPAYVDISNNAYTKIVKDREGNFSMYSTGGSAVGNNVGGTYSKTAFMIEKLTDGDVDICFGENRFVVRFTPNSDGNSYSVNFGWDGKSDNTTLLQEFYAVDTGKDIGLNEKAEIQCITIENPDGSCKGTLFIDGIFASGIVMPEPTDVHSINVFHVKYRFSENVISSFNIYDWMLWYRQNIPDRIYEIYDSIVKEEKEIWRWIATMYDGTGTLKYRDGVDVNHLKYNSMNYIEGGTGNGFFYAPSSKAYDDKFCAEIESTGQVLGNMSTVGLLKYMPQNIRDRFYQFFADKYRSDADARFGTGYYDTLYSHTVNSRGHSRNQSNAAKIQRVDETSVTRYSTSTDAVFGDKANANDPMTLLLSLDNENAEVMPDLSSETNSVWTNLTGLGKANASNMLAAINSGAEAFGNWIECLPWHTHSWTAGDLLSNTPAYIEKIVPQEERAAYYNQALSYLLENQNSNGTWWKPGGSPEYFGTEVSGIFKICLFLQDVPDVYLNTDADWTAAGLSASDWMPKAQIVYDYIIYNIKNYEDIVTQKGAAHRMNATLEMRNALDVVNYIRGFIDKKLLESDMPVLVDFSYNFMLQFKLTEGEYVSSINYDEDGNIVNKYSSSSTGMGNQQSLGLSEGCINTCTSITKIYTCLSNFYGIRRPTFDKQFATEFFNILQNELDTQQWRNFYSEKYQAYDQIIAADFENLNTGELSSLNLDDNSFMNYTGTDTSNLQVIKDNQTGSKAIKFAFSPADKGASVSFKTNMLPAIPVSEAVMEFDIKYDSGPTNPGTNIFYFGMSGAAQFSTRTDGERLKIVTRTASNKIGTKALAYINSDKWYRVKMVYIPDADNKLQLYLDDTLVYSGNDYSGSAGDASPSYNIKDFNVVYYMATEGALYIDNFYAKACL